MKALAADLAGTGVTANAVCPGSTRTALLDVSARLYDLASAEEFASQQLLGAPARPGRAGGADRLAVHRGLERAHRAPSCPPTPGLTTS